MTDQRQRRIDTLSQAARRKSEAKTKAAETAIRSLIKRGKPITFQAVQREAGVSHSFLYTHPTLRDRIEQLRQQNQAAPPPPSDAASENNIALALTTEIARLKKRLRDQDKELREALAQAHGENLELRREIARRGGSVPPAPTSIIGPC
ncbi:DUF6262 family protein [Streptomyces sp. NBC_01221]|uniref:DUF6262 family protein n=1 Tax=Streptomyces sp. NBC_01221 TaxID=2903782 RepID=UPI0022528343|nr:DUF6262 family protein [Streptomyces sp. NBC_01221]MCX4792239.1 DUF6262 family protein [Streptomyces sp. NBC_01221]